MPEEKREVIITAGIEAVCPTAPYSNQRFNFTATETIKVENDDELHSRHTDLGNKCYKLFKEFETRAIEERIRLERQDFRFYTNKNGELVPSVTTFLNFDADFFVSKESLLEYAAHGKMLEQMAIHRFETGEWITDPKEIVERYPELWGSYVTVAKGQLGLGYDNWDFPAFLGKHPFLPKGWKVKVMNEEKRYGGELDAFGEFEGKITIADFKRTPDEHKNFMQMACYAKSDFEQRTGFKAEQLMIIQAGGGGNKQGFSKPKITTDIDKYFNMAMVKRQQFKERYGL